MSLARNASQECEERCHHGIGALAHRLGHRNQHPARRNYLGLDFSGKFGMALEKSDVEAESKGVSGPGLLASIFSSWGARRRVPAWVWWSAWSTSDFCQHISAYGKSTRDDVEHGCLF
jgi:hypothetical protein